MPPPPPSFDLGEMCVGHQLQGDTADRLENGKLCRPSQRVIIAWG
jgi:hypothetical protein